MIHVIGVLLTVICMASAALLYEQAISILHLVRARLTPSSSLERSEREDEGVVTPQTDDEEG